MPVGKYITQSLDVKSSVPLFARGGFARRRRSAVVIRPNFITYMYFGLLFDYNAPAGGADFLRRE